MQSLEDFKQKRIKVFKSFPDWHVTIEDLIAEGDKMWAHFAATGTHKGEYLGFTPTGKKITASGIDKWRTVNGKIAEHFKGVNDEIDFLKQLGIIEYTEKAKKILPEDVS